MGTPGEAKTAWQAAFFGVIVVGAGASLLVATFGWLFAGLALFGLTIGLLIGMTKSAVVAGVLPLLFTFAGGSILALSTGEGRTAEQLDTLGKQLAGFGIGTIAGVLFGIALQRLGVDIPLGKFRE